MNNKKRLEPRDAPVSESRPSEMEQLNADLKKIRQEEEREALEFIREMIIALRSI